MAQSKQPSPETPQEQVQEVRTFRTLAACGAQLDGGTRCEGTLEHDSYVTPLMTPLGPDPKGRELHRHKCSGCGRPAWLESAYPRIQYAPVEAESEKAEA